MSNPHGEIMELNVAGVTSGFQISKQILCSVPGSMMERLFCGEHEIKKQNGKIFVDRNPTIFQHVIDYLRNDRASFNIEDKAIADLFKLELKHWKLDRPEQGILQVLQHMLNGEPLNASSAAIKKWKELEPLNLEKLLDDNQLEFDPRVHKNVVKESLKQNSNNFDYVG